MNKVLVNSGGLSIKTKVLEIENTKGEIRMNSTGGDEIYGDLNEFLKGKIVGDVKLINTLPPIKSDVDSSRIEIIDLPVTGKARVKVEEIDELKTKYYPLGVTEFLKIMKNKNTYVPDVLRQEKKVFLFVGTKIVETVVTFDKNGKKISTEKEYFLCLLFHINGRLYKNIQSVDEPCDFKTIVIKRPQI